MENQPHIELITKDNILRLLSDDEVAAVSTAESKPKLAKGDEYLDLEQLERGVLHASGKDDHMNGVLPRKAVHAKTWTKILNRLGAAHM